MDFRISEKSVRYSIKPRKCILYFVLPSSIAFLMLSSLFSFVKYIFILKKVNTKKLKKQKKKKKRMGQKQKKNNQKTCNNTLSHQINVSVRVFKIGNKNWPKMVKILHFLVLTNCKISKAV